MSKDLKKVLDNKDKSISTSKSSLTRLFRKIMFDHGITNQQWYNLSTRYFRGTSTNRNKTTRQINQDRNNLNRSLAKPKIQWSNFITALRILRPDEIEFTVKMRWIKRDITTVHTLEFIPEDIADDEEADNE